MKPIYFLLALALALGGCSKDPLPITRDGQGAIVARLPSATATHVPTTTPIQTRIITPTPNPRPTDTPRPTATATEEPLSPFGNPFVVLTARIEQSIQVVGANLDKEPVKSYVLTEGLMAYKPVWSPDGTKIAYISYDRAADQNFFKLLDILQNGEARQLSPQAINLVGSYCWTFDQKYLIWGDHQPDGSEMDIYRLDVTTGEIVNLTQESTVWDAFPACSPASGRIAFVSDRKGTGKQEDNIWVMDSQGENLKQVTNTPYWENKYPGWAPDGSDIAFFRFTYSGETFAGDDQYGPSGLWAVKTDGSRERLVTEIDAAAGSSLEAPAWSPDGKYIAYSIGDDDETTIIIVSAADGELLWSSDLPGENSEISWSASSKYLIFTNILDNASRIYLIAIDDPQPAPLLPEPNNRFGMFGPGKK